MCIHMKRKTIGYLLLVIALLLSAIMPIAFKLGSNIDPLKLMFFASFIGLITSFIVTLLKHTTKQGLSYFTDKKALMAMAAFGVFDYTILTLIFSYVTHFVSAPLVAVIYRTWALMLVLLAPFIIRERVSKYDIIAVLIGFGSFVVVMLQGTPLSIPFILMPFVLIVLFGAFLDAFTNAVTKRYSYELTSSIFAYNLIAFVLFAILAAYFGQINLIGFNLNDVIAVVFIGVVVDVALTFAFVDSIRMLDVAFVSTANIIVPFITIILSFILLDEPMYLYYFVIAGGVAAGLLVQLYAPKKTNYISKDEHIRNYKIFDVSGAFSSSTNPVIYNMLKGNGRALALKFDAKSDFYNIIKNNINESKEKGNEVIMFTNSEPINEVNERELEFIKNIVDHKDETVLIGIGDPDAVEEKFVNINSLLKEYKDIE